MNEILNLRDCSTALALILIAVAGCRREPEGPEPAATVAIAAPAEHSKESPVRGREERAKVEHNELPGMEPLTTQDGIRRKVIPVVQGLHAMDSVQGGRPVDPPLRFFIPYFLFEAQPNAEKPDWYLVGSNPQRKSIIGWVPAGSVVAWNHRVGARYRRRAGERVPTLVVYAEAEPLLELEEKGTTTAKPIARAQLKAERALMPWAITDIKTFTVRDRAVELWKISFLGEKIATGADLASLSSSPVSYSDEEFKQIQGRARMLDVVFVMDVTGSMSPYIEAAKATVREISRALRELDTRPEIAFGITAYRDHLDSGFVTRHFDLETDYDLFVARLGTLSADGGGDQPEAVYDGVHDALTKTSWRGQGLSDRVVILIGDCSAHEPGDPQNPRRISRNDLVSHAKKREVNAKIFSLVVGSEGDGSSDAKLRSVQFGDLARRTGGACFPLASASAVVPRVKAILQTEIAVVHQTSMVLEGIRRGDKVEKISETLDLKLSRITEIMEFLGGRVDLDRIPAGVPTHASGWVLPAKDGVPILEREVYLAQAELAALIRTIWSLDGKLRDLGMKAGGIASHWRLFDDWWENDRDLPLQVRLKTVGLPFGRNSILRRSPQELEYMSQKDRIDLLDRLIRTHVPLLTNDRTDESLWDPYGSSDHPGLKFGWIPEEHLP